MTVTVIHRNMTLLWSRQIDIRISFETSNHYIKISNMSFGGDRVWFIDYLLFYVPLNIQRRHHYRWKAAKFRPILGAQGVWAGRDLYRATPAETRGLGFSGLIRRTTPFSRLLRHTRGCGGSILTYTLTWGSDRVCGWSKNVFNFFFYLLHCY
jgi:hypothetical protein